MRPRVILISFDGMRPEFYLNPERYFAPHLQRLAREGARARSMQTIYPSVTYAAHTTMVTGVLPVEHGVWGNTVYSLDPGPRGGSTTEWYWNASWLRHPTLWGETERAGKKVAILTWPVTVGAKTHVLVPEIFPRVFPSSENTWDLIRKNMDPELLQRLSAQTAEPKIDQFEPHDRWITDAAVYYARGLSPEPVDLVMIHLIDTDHQAHEWGRDSAQAMASLKVADEQIGRIWEANAQGLQATFVVTGDHGFYDYDRLIHLGALLGRGDWLSSGRVRVHLAGSQATVYLRDPSDRKLGSAVLRFLRAHERAGLYRVVSRRELDHLGALPGALCGLDPLIHRGPGLPGASFVMDSERTALLSPLLHLRGNHGPLPSAPELQTGFIAAGPGIAAQDLGAMSILDVAPTLARELGIERVDSGTGLGTGLAVKQRGRAVNIR